jgi:hypothetical protein
MRLRTPTLACFAFALSVSLLVAQPPNGRGNLPLLEGDPIPQVSGYFADGTEIALPELKGSTTVIAFGCLT